MEESGPYYISTPVHHQAILSLVAVFRESVEFIRNYTCPFDMLGICTRSEGREASVQLNLKNNERNVSELNELHLVPINLPQRYHHTLRNEHLAIHFKLELFPGVDVYTGQEHVLTEFSPQLTEQAKAIFQLQDPIRMLTACQAFALDFCLRHWPEHYNFQLDAMRPYADVLHFISQHADALTSIPELAKIIHKPDSSFTRDFHDVFKMSPKQFLQQELYKKAAKMLLAPNATVKTTAEALRFSSEFYFSHFFKRMSGISPKEYQNRQKIACF